MPIWWPLVDEFVVGAGLRLLLLLPLLLCAFLPVAGDADELLVDAAVVVVPDEFDVAVDELVVVVVIDAVVDDFALDASVAD